MDYKKLVKRYEEQNEELRKLNSIQTNRIYNLLQENESLTNHVSFMRDFNAELMKENLELQSRLLPKEAYKDEDRPTNGE